MGRTIYASETVCCASESCGRTIFDRTRVEHIVEEGIFCTEDCSVDYIIKKDLSKYKIPFPAFLVYFQKPQ